MLAVLAENLPMCDPDTFPSRPLCISRRALSLGRSRRSASRLPIMAVSLSTNKRIPSGARNTILSPAETAALPYSEDR